jgi:hypothetical protein
VWGGGRQEIHVYQLKFPAGVAQYVRGFHLLHLYLLFSHYTDPPSYIFPLIHLVWYPVCHRDWELFFSPQKVGFFDKKRGGGRNPRGHGRQYHSVQIEEDMFTIRSPIVTKLSLFNCVLYQCGKVIVMDVGFP